MATIIFNGKTYNSIEEMPSNEKQAYEKLMNIFVDKNGNGVPDFMEGDMVKNVMSAVTSNININGQMYGGMNELPDDVRAKIQGAFEKMTELGIVTKTTSPMVMGVNSLQVSKEPQKQSKPLVSQEYASAIQEDKSSNALPLILIGLAAIICLAVAAVAVFYFMK
jgi:hypothetical protein